MKINNINCERGVPQFRHYIGDLPLSYIFIESVISSGILSENSAGMVGNALQAGVQKLQNLLTPGASSDLEAVLHFMAPKSSGVKGLNELIKSASESPGPLTADNKWWASIFQVFGVVDATTQQQIQQQTAQAAGAAPTDAPSAAPAGGAAPTADPTGAVPSADPTDRLSTIKAHNAQIGNWAKEQLAAYKSGGAAPAVPPIAASPAATPTPSAFPPVPSGGIDMDDAHAADVRARGREASARRGLRGGPASESILNSIAGLLIREGQVRSNLRFVAQNMMRRLGYTSAHNFEEPDWLKKFISNVPKAPVEEGFKDYFNNARAMIANPGLANMKSQSSALKNYNQRVAKLAVKLLSDHVTHKFSEQLKVAGLTPDVVMKTVREYSQLKAAAHNGATTPAQSQQLVARYQKIKPTLELITNTLTPKPPTT